MGKMYRTRQDIMKTFRNLIGKNKTQKTIQKPNDRREWDTEVHFRKRFCQFLNGILTNSS